MEVVRVADLDELIYGGAHPPDIPPILDRERATPECLGNLAAGLSSAIREVAFYGLW